MSKIPLLEIAKPEDLPPEFLLLTDINTPIPDNVEFEESYQPAGLRAFFALLFSPLLIVVSISVLLQSLTAEYINHNSLLLSILVSLMALILLFFGGYLIYSYSKTRKEAKLQKSEKSRLGNFYHQDALLQKFKNYVNLIPKEKILRIEEHKISIESPPKFVIQVNLIYESGESEHALEFDAGSDWGNPTKVAKNLSEWSGIPVDRFYTWP